MWWSYSYIGGKFDYMKIEKDIRLQNDLKTKLAKPDESIRTHTDKLKTEAKRLRSYGYINDEIYSLLNVACEYHDYGKLNAGFQKRIENKTKYNGEKEVPHNILSMLFLDKEYFENKEDYYIVLMSIIYHHKLRDDLAGILEEKADIIRGSMKMYEPYVTNLSKLNNWITIRKINDLIHNKNRKAIIVKGLLHKCDYSASAGIQSEFKNDFMKMKLEELRYGWIQKNRNADWNDLQKFCMEHSNDNLIVTAPTGMGKTEAGLWWIENHKGFFVLPLRTAINAMYERVAEDILNNEKIEERLGLLHSDMKAYYLNDDREVDNVQNYMECTGQMALPITISTMDQLFDFVFQYPGYEYKLSQLSYAKIVIDEIQMYDTALLAFLIYGIERIHEVGGKIAVLTATLPPFVEKELENALGGDYVNNDYSEQGITRHNVEVLDKIIDSQDVRQKYLELIESNKNAKILVVCNSIENAQSIYEELSDLNVNLLHSKFIGRDRKKKEEEILDCGKTFSGNSNEILNKKQEIWISTSLVEASLDIDFDYLFTELNDVFSLFQRMGRCNRKGAKEWYQYETNCFVYLNPRGSVKTYIEKSDMYKLSKIALQDRQGIITEKEKKEIIDVYFSVDKIKETDYAKNYYYDKRVISENLPYEHDTKVKLRDILTVDVIPYSVYKLYQEEIDDVRERLNNSGTVAFERISLISKLKEFCLSIQEYEKKQCESKGEKINLGKNHAIEIIECEYSKELGFVKNRKESKSIEEVRLREGGIFID